MIFLLKSFQTVMRVSLCQSCILTAEVCMPIGMWMCIYMHTQIVHIFIIYISTSAHTYIYKHWRNPAVSDLFPSVSSVTIILLYQVSYLFPLQSFRSPAYLIKEQYNSFPSS